MVATAKKQQSQGLVLIEELTQAFQRERIALADKMNVLDKETRAIKMKHRAGIKAAAGRVKDAHSELRAAIEANAGEFVKPRTRSFFGIKVGFRKLVGTISWKDAAQVVTLIKKHFADQKDVLVKTTETPVKDALAQLSGADLKRLGCSVSEDTDEVVIKATDSDIDKLVDAFLKEGSDD